MAIHLPDTEAAKAHVDCRGKTKVSPRNDNLEARHAILAATVRASAYDGGCSYHSLFIRAQGILHRSQV